MQMDSRSSHPRILRGPASEVLLTNQPQGASELICQKNFACSPLRMRGCDKRESICIYVYM